MLSDQKILCFRFAFLPIVSYNGGRETKHKRKDTTMNYQNLLNQAGEWIATDPTNIAYVILGVVIIGSILTGLTGRRI